MSEELSSGLGNLELAEKDQKEPKDEKMPEGGPGQPAQPVEAFQFMLDLKIPGHFPTQASTRRFLHNIMYLGSNLWLYPFQT